MVTLIAGCNWTPDRSNPFDPNSPVYVEPPVSNRPPQINGLVVNTNCVNFPTEDQCGVTIKARISDTDSNLRIGNVVATINQLYFGHLAYDPVDTLWILTKQETELDSAVERFVGSLVKVSVSDDSNAFAEDTVRFPSLFRDYPTINWPNSISQCICPDYRNFSWNRWTGSGQARELEIKFYFLNFDLVPSLTISDINPSDTTVVVNQNFVPSDSNGTIFYGWRLFVVDRNGNSAGSVSGLFRYLETCTAECGI